MTITKSMCLQAFSVQYCREYKYAEPRARI